MSASVSSIITAIKAQAASALGGSSQELKHVFDVSANDERMGQLAYGVRALGASSTPGQGTLRTVTYDHQFELILTNTNPKSSDADATTVIGALFSLLDEIYKAMAQSNLGVSTVLLVNEPSLSEPELINSGELIVLRMQFNVRYRHTI